MKTQNLGKAFSIIVMAEMRETAMHEDVSAFGAPSECHSIIEKGEIERRRIAYRHARSVSGLTRSAFKRAMRNDFPKRGKGSERLEQACWFAVTGRDF